MVDFTIYAGEDWPQTFKYEDASHIGIPITGAVILFVADSGTTHIKKSTTHSTITLANQTTNPGEFTVAIAAADTTTMGGKTFQYEIKLTLDAIARVVYPAPGAAATFNVDTSLTDGVSP